VELIRKSLHRPPVHNYVNKTAQQLVNRDECLTDTGAPYSTAPCSSLRQQAEELYKRMSQQSDVVDGPLQRLRDALYTCDPHKTGKF